MIGMWPELIVPEGPTPYRHVNDHTHRKIEWEFMQMLLDEYAQGRTWSSEWAGWVVGTTGRTIIRWKATGFAPQNAVEDLLERRERGEIYHLQEGDDVRVRSVIAAHLAIVGAVRDEKGWFVKRDKTTERPRQEASEVIPSKGPRQKVA